MKTFNQAIKTTFCLILLITSIKGVSQNVGINTTGNRPDTSAMLDISNTAKGLLIPRVSLTSLTNVSIITTPATSLLVYNTNASLSGGVEFYYNSGTTSAAIWTKLATSGASNGSTWGLTGNSGIDSSANFIGTTNETNATSRVNISSAGVVTIGDGTNQNNILIEKQKFLVM